MCHYVFVEMMDCMMLALPAPRGLLDGKYGGPEVADGGGGRTKGCRMVDMET